MRNLWILTVAQALGSCGMIMLVTYGGIIGTRIAPAPALATLPLALTIVGIALSTIPAAMTMRRWGRKRGFIASGGVGVAAALLAAWAIAHAQFPLFCLAGMLIGVHQAFILQYRFAATEYVPAESAGRAIGMIMLGILAAAVLAPEIGDRGRLMAGWPEFTGSFVMLALLCLAGVMLLLTLQPAVVAAQTAAPSPERTLTRIAAQPAFVVAVLASVSSFAVMSFIMTATPISMHVHDGFSVEQTQRVITAHIIAMYAPSLVSGWLTRTLGLIRMMLAGVALMALCVVIAVAVGQHFVHYLWAMIVLGAGWNLLFVAGTTLLTRVHSAGERFKVQGVNDFATFGVQAMVSLLAGTAIVTLGWVWLNLISVPLLLAMLLAIAWLHRDEIRRGKLRTPPASTPA